MRLQWLGQSINAVVIAAACIPAAIFIWLHIKGEEQQNRNIALSTLKQDLATIVSLSKFEPIRTFIANSQPSPIPGGVHPFVSQTSPNIGSNDAPYNATAERFPPACFTHFNGLSDPLAMCGVLATSRDEPHLKLGIAFCEKEINGWPQPTNESRNQYLPVDVLRSKVDHFTISLDDGNGFHHEVIASIGHLRTLPGNTNARAINAHELVESESSAPVLETSPRWRTAWLSNDMAHGILQCSHGEPRFLSAMIDLRCLWYEKQGRVNPRASEADCGTSRDEDEATNYVRSGVISPIFRNRDNSFFAWARSLQINATQHSSDGETTTSRVSTREAKGERNNFIIFHALGSYLKDHYHLAIAGSHHINWVSSPDAGNLLETTTIDVPISDLAPLDDTHRRLFAEDRSLRFSLGMERTPASNPSFFGPGSPFLFGVLVVLALLLIIFNYSVVMPVRRLSAAINHPIAEIKHVPYTSDQFEVGVLARALDRLLRDVTERDIALEERNTKLTAISSLLEERDREITSNAKLLDQRNVDLTSTEAKLEERNADLTKLAALLEQRDFELKINAHRIAGLEGILDGIAHDIKTPVHEIASGLRKYAASRELTADEVLLDARIRKIVDRIDVVERLSVGRRESANLAPFDVNEWLPTVPISFTDTEVILSDAPCVALASGALIEMIIENLWKNARRFKINSSLIRIGCVTRAEHAIIFVENDGPRIPEDRHSLLFRRGYTSGGGRSNRGLGLALASEYAVMLGGQLRFVDIPDGARFELWLRSA